MKRLALCGVLLAMSLDTGSLALAQESAPNGVMKELVPSGKLRVGVAYAPAPTPLFVTRDASGQAHGVTVDLGNALGQALGVAVDFLVAPNTGELTDAITSGKIDVAFMPADDERRKRVDFGPAYFNIESTYLVAGVSDIKTFNDVDRPGVTVVGIANSTTIRSAGRIVKTATIVPVASIDEAMGMVKAGKAQALALTHDSLPPIQKALPGSRILDGAFQTTGVAVAVQKDHPAALAYVTTFLENAKASGAVSRAFEKAGLSHLPVAPPEPRK